MTNMRYVFFPLPDLNQYWKPLPVGYWSTPDQLNASTHFYHNISIIHCFIIFLWLFSYENCGETMICMYWIADCQWSRRRERSNAAQSELELKLANSQQLQFAKSSLNHNWSSWHIQSCKAQLITCVTNAVTMQDACRCD